MISARIRQFATTSLVVGLGLALSGCRVGPQYVRPTAPTAPEFKESPPENFQSDDGWKRANPTTRN